MPINAFVFSQAKVINFALYRECINKLNKREKEII